MLCIFKEMKIHVLLVVLLVSCAPKTGFNLFFEDEVAIADQAIELPKWLPMLAIPKAAKEDVKRLSNGMKKVKLLRYSKYQETGLRNFSQYQKENDLDMYLEYQEKDTRVNILSKEDENTFNEIIIACETDEEFYLFGLTGKMKKKDFQTAIREINERINQAQ